ncbi:hypothetical protein GRI35_08365 [Altererythrobacter aestiaquae]|uniref:Uncharacterized protein n=2 Tax=Pontixanthobacter aestiaquae TaxID=1509367 RepID=A0A844Z811_9SPHN|nr:hypothetical protein [Pontixanthobacter aestiaquae]
MAQKGVGYFDKKGHFFKNPAEATISDLAAMLGQIGEGDSLAPGIAHMLLEKRAEVEAIFAEHDLMTADMPEAKIATLVDHANVAVLADRKSPDIDKAV